MDKKNCGDYEVTCSSCGRPWAVCKEKGGCSKCGDVRFCEYGRKASGCIREKQPGCPMQAVIPSVTVDTVNGIKGLSDCLVHVADINTTYYIDDQHRLLTTWGGPVSVYDYDFDENPLNLRNQMAYDTANNILAIYDKAGVAYKVPISNLDNDYNVMVNKPQINGHELIGNKTSTELGLQSELTAGANIQINDNTISATDTTYTAGQNVQINDNVISATDTTYTAGDGVEIDGTEVKAKIGDSLEFGDNGEIDVSDPAPEGFFDGEATMNAFGSSISVIGSAHAPFNEVVIYGDSSQNGTPDPTNEIKINTVTGEQIVSISDTASSNQVLHVDLGVLELCKIENAADYIYKNNDDQWYMHKEIGHIKLEHPTWYAINGTSASSSATSSNGAFTLNYGANGISQITGSAKSNYMTWMAQTVTGNSGANSMIDKTFVQRSGTNDRLYYRNTNLIGTTGDQLSSMMSNQDFYFVLPSPEETLITDASLVEQLELLSMAKTYHGATTINVSGELPMNLSVSIYKDNWNGHTSGAGKWLDDTYSKFDAGIDKSRASYIFPKFADDQVSGDSSIIKYRGRAIMIDCNNTHAWASVKAMLDDNNVSHIDYLVISHYHGDHAGNFYNLHQYGYIDSTTKLYMPAEVTAFSFGQTEMNAVKNYCQANGLDYYVPSEYERLVIDDLSITFFNCDAQTLDTLYGPTDSYNNVSTVCLIEHGIVRSFFGGDIEKLAQHRVIEEGFIKGRVSLQKIDHHGIDPEADEDYLRIIDPIYAVQEGGIGSYSKNDYGQCRETTVFSHNGTKIFPNVLQDDYIRFESTTSGLKCIAGKTQHLGSRFYNNAIYVDASVVATAYQDGTLDHPFREIMQAIPIIENEGTENVAIYLADGEYGSPYGTSSSPRNGVIIRTGKNTLVRIYGNTNDPSAVKLSQVVVSNANVRLQGLTIDLDRAIGNYGLDVGNANLSMQDVSVLSGTGVSTNKTAIHIAQKSDVTMTSVSVNDCAGGIDSSDSSLFLNSLNYGSNISGTKLLLNRSYCVTGNIGFATIADKRAFTQFNTKNRPSEILFDGTEAATITLPKSVSDYDWIEVTCSSTSDAIRWNSGRIYNKDKIAPLIERHDGNKLISKMAYVTFSGTNVAISNHCRLEFDGTNWSMNTTDTAIYVRKIIGGFNNTIDMRS